jgi:ESF2/ABP1 family protein
MEEVEDVEIKEEPMDEEEDVKPDIAIKEEEKKLDLSSKVSKAGIIYLSTIPPKMNVTQIREYFAAFGEVGRSFLQPEKSN